MPTPAQRISTLSPTVTNQIAAGEVIERPATALKELIENSLDAGADDITLTLREGGIEQLQIEDNGSGIHVDDLPLALCPHATSKIKQVSDLSTIHTLGFRGEALASLASVTELTIASRTNNDQHGWLYAIGKKSPTPQPMPIGTIVTAHALFANIPARRRFLRTAATESAHCLATVQRLALSAPTVTFSLINNQRQRLALPIATATIDRLTALFPDLTDNTLPVIAETNGLSLEGHIFSPALINSSKRIGQFFYINNRFIRDRLIRRAVTDALREVNHHGEPGYALFLHIKAANIDVNVHPTKLEVRFAEPGAIFDFIRQAIGKAIAKPLGVPIRDTSWAGAQPINEQAPTYFGQRHNQSRPLPITSTDPKDALLAWQQLFNDEKIPASTTDNLPPTTTPVMTNLQPLGRVLGQLHDIYIIAENAAGLVIVDMHAAHERILYEALRNATNQGEIPMQTFLSPLQIPLTDLQATTLNHHQHNLTGMVVRQSNNQTAEITAISHLIAGSVDSACLLTDILDDLGNDINSEQISWQQDRILSSIACHAAVRAHRQLSLSDMDNLLRQMEASERSGNCNHGRPCWQQIDRQYFDRLFRRGQ